jgi:hypothetical protein
VIQLRNQPNHALEPTASSFGFAYASGGGSPRAFGGDPKTQVATDSAFGAVPREEAFSVVTI